MYTKVKDILRTFEPDNHKMLRTSQPQNFFTGPYKKKCISRNLETVVMNIFAFLLCIHDGLRR